MAGDRQRLATVGNIGERLGERLALASAEFLTRRNNTADGLRVVHAIQRTDSAPTSDRGSSTDRSTERGTEPRRRRRPRRARRLIDQLHARRGRRVVSCVRRTARVESNACPFCAGDDDRDDPAAESRGVVHAVDSREDAVDHGGAAAVCRAQDVRHGDVRDASARPSDGGPLRGGDRRLRGLLPRPLSGGLLEAA